MKTIAIDFDGVIHKYSKGWQDGSIYDEPVEGAIPAINELIEGGYSVIIFSTRKSSQIIQWLRNRSNFLLYNSFADFWDQYYPFAETDETLVKAEYEDKNKLQFRVKKIPFWTKFWNENKVIGVTKRKLPCHVYIDDRAIPFTGDWNEIIGTITHFKTYQQ